MRVSHVSTGDLGGGAARAAYRLHGGLNRLGLDSHMFVRQRLSDDPKVKDVEYPSSLVARVRRLVRRSRIAAGLRKYAGSRPAEFELFSSDHCDLGASVLDQMPVCDVVNLHWVSGFVDYQAFFSAVPQETPVVWTLHDMNPFTGGCHYDEGCGKYTAECGACPQLGSRDPKGLSRQVWRRKRRALTRVDSSRLHIVTPSRWLKEIAKKSSLLGGFSVTVIPYGLDTHAFAPRDRRTARDALRVPPDARVIMFAAQSVANRRKGFSFLMSALPELKDIPNLVLVSVGDNKPQVETPVPHMHFNRITNDDILSLIYSAADVFVIPSLQDNLPNTVMESMACGTPVVGFAVGGIPDMVRPGETGLLAPAEDVPALGNAIRQLLSDDAARTAMSENCRRIAVEEYALDVQARRYAELYEKVAS